MIKIISKNVNELKPYENNARINDDAIDIVANSIKEFGFKNPCIIDKNNVLIAGHTRVEACKKLGIKDIPCIIADDLTEEQIKAFRIADNSTAQIADWDLEKLNAELATIDFDMSEFGLAEQIKEIEQEFAKEVIEDEVPEVADGEPITKLGDIWQLGRHRLMCGDSTVLEDVQKLMGGDVVDLLLTDPPYNVDYEGKTKDRLTIKNDKMANSDFYEFLLAAFSNAYCVMREGAGFYVWHADTEGFNFRGACVEAGLPVRQCLVWNKNTLVMGRQDYHWKHEPCLYGWKGGAGHKWCGDRKQTTVIDWDKPSKSEEHPTMKPVGLFDYQIKNSTDKNDSVLDLFAGSGTTLVACEQNGRKSYNLELDPKYCDVIIKRWETLTGQKAVKIS